MEEKFETNVDIVKTFTGHQKDVNCLLYFEHPFHIIISGGDDQFIHIWDCESGKLLKRIDNHTDCVYDLLRHGNDFFSCSWAGEVFMFDIKGNLKLDLTDFLKEANSLLRLAVIDADSIVVSSIDCHFYHVSVSKKKLLSRCDLLVSKRILWQSMLKTSIFNENSFYVNPLPQSSMSSEIYLVNIERNEIIKTFNSRSSGSIYSICIFLNKRNCEMVLAATDYGEIFIFNTLSLVSTPYVSSLIDVSPISKTKSHFVSCVYLGSKYICVGDGKFGWIYFCRICDVDEKSLKIELLDGKKIFSGGILCFVKIPVNKNCISLVMGSKDSSVSLVKMYGDMLNFSDENSENEIQDLKERIEFLRIDFLGFGQSDICKIKLKKKIISRVWKILLINH